MSTCWEKAGNGTFAQFNQAMCRLFVLYEEMKLNSTEMAEGAEIVGNKKI